MRCKACRLEAFGSFSSSWFGVPWLASANGVNNQLLETPQVLPGPLRARANTTAMASAWIASSEIAPSKNHPSFFISLLPRLPRLFSAGWLDRCDFDRIGL
jgi:hypothetical protein